MPRTVWRKHSCCFLRFVAEITAFIGPLVTNLILRMKQDHEATAAAARDEISLRNDIVLLGTAMRRQSQLVLLVNYLSPRQRLPACGCAAVFGIALVYRHAPAPSPAQLGEATVGAQNLMSTDCEKLRQVCHMAHHMGPPTIVIDMALPLLFWAGRHWAGPPSWRC